MTYRALIPAVALLAVLAGCENKPAEAPKSTPQAKVTPLPPAAPAAPAASGGQDAAPAAQTAAVMGIQQATAMKPACKGGANCNIDVMVSGDPCSIAKHPPKKHVAKGSPEKLTWTIQNTGGSTWDFDANGVSFPGAGASVFTCKAAGAGKYECDDKNADAAPTPYNYNVKVKDKGGKTCSNDPMIVNGADVTNPE